MCADLPSLAVVPGWYQVAKDFAPTIITAITGATALVVTYSFNKRQAATAQRAADIAHDRLRFDLFDKRYAIYQATKDLIRMVLNDSHQADFRPFDIVPFLIIIDEAPFFFSGAARQLFSGITSLAQKILEAISERNTVGSADHSYRTQSAALISADCKQLADAGRNMPMLFADALSFPQLTGPPAKSQK
jgi:hypothetical protein